MANEYLKRTPTSTGNRKVFTWSGWFKRNTFQDDYLFSAGATSTNIFYVSVRRDANNNNLTILFRDGDTTSHTLVFDSNSFRDVGSWMHMVVAVDTTSTVASDRCKVYINGSRLTNSTTNTLGDLTSNSSTAANSLELHTIGEYSFSSGNNGRIQLTDYFFIDGQSLTPEVFGFYKDGKGYISAGSTQATDFRNGQWVPRKPSNIIQEINDNGGFGVNGFYLPMNDSSNPGADFHCAPNSIIKLKGEDLPQPRNGAPTTSDAYVSQLRTDPYAANLVLAVPGISTATGANLVTNGTFDSNIISGWTAQDATLSVDNGKLSVYTLNTSYGSAIQTVTGLTIGQRYIFQVNMYYIDGALVTALSGASGSINSGWQGSDYVWRTSFTAATTSLTIDFQMASITNITGLWDNVILKQEDAPRDYSADIKGSGTNKTLTANGNAGVGYEIPSYYGSALSFDGTDDYFSVPNTADLRMGSDDFTVEAWFNANDFTGGNGIVGIWNYTGGIDRRSWLLYAGSSNDANFIVSSNGTSAGQVMASSGNNILTINQWNHLVGEKEGTTIRLYVNGVVVGISTVAPSSLYENTDDTLKIGTWDAGSTEETNGYIQDLRVYKGVAKYKGGFDVPKPYTPVGIEAFRTTTDTCKNNFATLNPLDTSNLVPFNGNLSIDQSSGGWHTLLGTHYVRSGKWYAEMRIDRLGWIMFGIDQTWLQTLTRHIGGQTGSKGIALVYNTASRGDIAYNGVSSVYTGGDATAANGDIISIALDLDSNNIKFYKNNVLQYNLTNILESGADYGFGVSPYSNVAVTVNFGQNPSFSGQTTAGTNADDSGKGLFKYQPPSGFLALCEDNLPTPAIADPGDYMRTVLWTGDGNSGRSIAGVGFAPDLVWIKRRSADASHFLFDSVRGAGKFLQSQAYAAEGNDPINTLMSFDNDGFTSGNTNGMNQSTHTYVAWCWKAGGPAVTNTDGTITSQVSANQTAGFSIVSYTGTGTGSPNIGHGLNKKPNFIIVKERNSPSASISSWQVYHSSLGATQRIQLNLTNAADIGSGTVWNDTEPTSDVFYVGGSGAVNEVNSTFIAYCWTEIEAFSKFGSYVGNGSADGVFVYCGFKPAWVMIKRTDTTDNWYINDSSRNSTNVTGSSLMPNLSNIESSIGGAFSATWDILSNGFKLRDGGTGTNASNGTYIFAAFAESPFKYSNSK